MIYKLQDINDLDIIVNEVLKYDVVTLYKSVKSNNGFYNKLRLGYYYIYDGDNQCDLFCDKSLISQFKTVMANKGYTLSKERKGRVR